ncbi:Gag-Pol protein [Plakobranchus ocellatus]|uniref:Gag-Pol protein n=1 Tax=Plakobranchus ocellatus TaxID=259542 RepID=A0AAV4C343_9GAST|nr:Gag-Pol protein [Plakobranchus ocellatus]
MAKQEDTGSQYSTLFHRSRRAFRRRLLTKAHEDHPCIVRMKRKLHQSYWWPGQDKDIDNFVKYCADCQLNDKPLLRNYYATAVTPHDRSLGEIMFN